MSKATINEDGSFEEPEIEDDTPLRDRDYEMLTEEQKAELDELLQLELEVSLKT